MKKKIIFIMLVLFPIFVYADEKTIFSLNEVTASPGNNVTINLNLNNNQEFGVLTVRIHYDQTKLEFVSSELNGLTNGIIHGVDDNNEKGLIALYGISLNSKKLMNDNGNILTIEFKIKEDAKEDIPLELEIVDFGLDESKSLEYESKNGIIHIKSDVETVSKDNKLSLTEKFKEEMKEQGIEQEDVIWKSTDENVATVDEEGNVQFKDNGNVVIEGKDTDGNVLYSKEYFIKDNVNRHNGLLASIICLAIFISIVVLIIVIRRRKCKKEK